MGNKVRLMDSTPFTISKITITPRPCSITFVNKVFQLRTANWRYCGPPQNWFVYCSLLRNLACHWHPYIPSIASDWFHIQRGNICWSKPDLICTLTGVTSRMEHLCVTSRRSGTVSQWQTCFQVRCYCQPDRSNPANNRQQRVSRAE